MKNCCKCEMDVCWEHIYDWLDHMHRDPVANVVIYSSIAFFLGYTLLLNIVMLNALIAIMGDTYDRVSETRIERGLLQR